MGLDLELESKTQQNPPLLREYAHLSRHSAKRCALQLADEQQRYESKAEIMEECELPLINLNHLKSEDEKERLECEASIVKAACEWGFFQVVNHGVSFELFKKMRSEQKKLFNAPFEIKSNCGVLNNSYRWGNPNAITPNQFSWSEAFHIPLTKINDQASYGIFSSLREVMVEYASAMQEVAKLFASVLVMNLSNKEEDKGILLEEICNESTCFLRLNKYPTCPIISTTTPHDVYGLVPHTDSDFLTILHQDQVGGLHLMKDSKWMAVRPNYHALIVNIGDLFQAWSNDVYKSVEHKVMANPKVDRFSIAYFLCPSYDSIIGGGRTCNQQPKSTYRKFTFREYRNQIQHDVKFIGHKVGLSRFRV